MYIFRLPEVPVRLVYCLGVIPSRDQDLFLAV